MPSASGSASTPPLPSSAPVVVPRLPGTPELGKDGLYSFAGGGIELTIDPLSAVVTRFSLDGKNALLPTEPALNARLGAELEGSTLVLKASDGAWDKRFRLDTGRRSVEVTYTLTNLTPRPLRVGAVDSQRLASAAGLTFFPGVPLAVPGRALKLNAQQAMVWLAHDQNRETTTVEARACGTEGWIATVTDGMVVVRVSSHVAKPTFVITSAYDATTKVHPWIQIDQDSEAVELAPGASTTENVRLFLRKLPPTIAVKPGNQELVAFVRGVIE